MRVLLTEAAEADLDAMVMYIADESVQNAVAMDSRIRDRLRVLAEYPELGPVGRMHNTRELVAPHDRYVAVYRVEEEVIRVLRIIHGGQEWPLTI